MWLSSLQKIRLDVVRSTRLRFFVFFLLLFSYQSSYSFFVVVVYTHPSFQLVDGCLQGPLRIAIVAYLYSHRCSSWHYFFPSTIHVRIRLCGFFTCIHTYIHSICSFSFLGRFLFLHLGGFRLVSASRDTTCSTFISSARHDMFHVHCFGWTRLSSLLALSSESWFAASYH